MGLLGVGKEKKTQLFFRDDNKFRFIKRDLAFSSLVEKAGDSLKNGWKHFYGNQLPFPGYKNMQADMVTLGYSRDIILDPFDKVPKGTEINEKPDIKNKDNLKKWIAKIAENQRHIYRAKRETTFLVDRIAWVLIVIALIMAMAWGIRFAWG